MKIFVAALMTETNSFSVIPTSHKTFENSLLYRPKALSPSPEPEAYDLIGYGALLRKSRQKEYETYTSLHAFAEPGAPSNHKVYENLRDEILSDLRQTSPVDAVFLFLHGAHMAQGYDDCEGDIIQRIRQIVGPDTFIGVLLDLHGNISEEMLTAANALVACRFYPHTDFDDRAEHLFDIGERFVHGGIRTKNYFHRVPMLGMFYTTLPQMQALDRDADVVEQMDGIHSVSLMHGFPWADQPDTGAGIIVVAEPDQADASDLAKELGDTFFSARNETRNLRQSIDDILDEIRASPADKPFIIADTADNAGGGAGSDSTFILKRLIERKVSNVTLGMIWDPIAVNFAYDAGQGGDLKLRLGGKTGPFAGEPVDVDATVVALSSEIQQNDPAGGVLFPIGRAALLKVGGILVVINTARQQVYDPACFTGFGLDLASLKIIVVKSSQHFYDQFSPISEKTFYCDTPGSLTLNFNEKFFNRLNRPIWPLDE